MSIVQISRIQHRSGLLENLPQLAKAELGYVVDQRRLFIGNGLVTDGAPQAGNTEILTEYSDILNLANLYNFENTDAGYNPQTGNAKAVYNGIAYNGSLYVVVGTSGNILTSTNGTTWTSTISGTSQDLLDITYGGGFFVAVGANGTVIYSTNGTVWSASGAVAYTNINAVTYAASKFVLVTELGQVYTSNNATTWSLQTSTVSVPLYAIAYGNSTFIAGGKGGTIITSSDSVTWTSQTVGYYDILGLRYIVDGSGSNFVATCTNNKVYYSTNGTTWSRALVDAFTSSTTDGTNAYAITSWGDVYQSSTASLVYYSNVLGTQGGIVGTGENFTCIYNNGAGLFTALNGSGGIYTSGNGITWTSRTSGVTTGLNSVYFDGTTWVVVGDGGVILTSTNGTTFTARTSGTTNNLLSVTKGAGSTWIAVGAGGVILTSPNSVTWTAQSSGTTSDLRTVTVANLGGGTYKAIAAGVGGIGVSSTNGTSFGTWISAIANTATDPLGNTVSLSDLNNIMYLTFTPPGGSQISIWMVVGDHGVIAISSNGTSWYTKTTNTYSNFLSAVYASTYFFVVGDNSLTYLTSQDDSTYKTTTVYYGANLLYPDLHDVATGVDSLIPSNYYNILSGAYGYVYSATNQVKYWHNSSAILNSTTESLGYFNSKYYAVGANGQISYSLNGVSWTSQSFSYGGTTTQRSIQKKLDDFVSVKDFGAKGDGVTDDTESINRALYELYVRPTSLSARKRLYFPAGNYIVSGSINVPTNARLSGEGEFNTTITQTANPYIYPYITWVMYTADSLQQIQNQIGLNGAQLPSNITVSDMSLRSLGDGIIIDSANSVQLQSVGFIGPFSNVTTATDTISGNTTAAIKLLGKSLTYDTDINVVDCSLSGFNAGIYVPANNYTTNGLFDSCTFTNLYYGVYLVGTSAKGLTLSNSYMNLVYANGVYASNCTNFVSLNNYYSDVGDHNGGVANPQVEAIYWASTAIGCASIGDNFDRTDYDVITETVGTVEWAYANYLRSGTLQQYSGRSTNITASTTAVINSTYDGFAGNTVIFMDYGIQRNSQIRTGTVKLSLTSGGVYSIDDDYSQSGDVGITFGYNGTDITYTSDGNGTGLLNYAIRYHELF